MFIHNAFILFNLKLNPTPFWLLKLEEFTVQLFYTHSFFAYKNVVSAKIFGHYSVVLLITGLAVEALSVLWKSNWVESLPYLCPHQSLILSEVLPHI